MRLFAFIVLLCVPLLMYEYVTPITMAAPGEIIHSQPTQLELFLRHMARRESDGKKHAVNQFGMMGKYQFAPSTVRILGYNVTKEEFLRNSTLQDSVMVAYMRANYHDLRWFIDKYNGKTVKGVRVTTSGILAAAHLTGSGNVRKWFADDDYEGRTDANGTSLRQYMKEFSNYEIRL